MAMALAIATRCFCPPDSSSGKFSAFSASPTRFSSAMPSSYASCLDFPSRFTGADMMFSMTVRLEKRLNDWNTMPIFCRIFSIRHFGSVMTSPSNVTVPEVGFSSWFRQRSSVDLPVPDGPMTEMTSPLLISTETSFNGVTLGYSLRKCSIWIMLILLSLLSQYAFAHAGQFASELLSESAK